MRLRTDLFAQLNNGQEVQKDMVQVAFSKFSLRILQILQEEGLIHHWYLTNKKTKKNSKPIPLLEVYFKRKTYLTHFRGKHLFKITAISKTSRPFYISAKGLWKLDRGLSLYIISTSRGLLTDRQARKLSLGGELICKIQ